MQHSVKGDRLTTALLFEALLLLNKDNNLFFFFWFMAMMSILVIQVCFTFDLRKETPKMACVPCFGKAYLSEEMNFYFLGSCCLNFSPWDRGLLRKCSRRVQSVFRLTLREIYMELDRNEHSKYLVREVSTISISNLKPPLSLYMYIKQININIVCIYIFVYIHTHTKCSIAFVVVLKIFSTQSLMKSQPDPQFM